MKSLTPIAVIESKIGKRSGHRKTSLPEDIPCGLDAVSGERTDTLTT